MGQYELLFQRDPLPACIPKFSQAGFLFNTPEHLRYQQPDGLYLLSAVNTLTRQADARCAFFVQSGQAVSPLSSPFGSIEFIPSFPEQSLHLFIHTLCRAAHSVGANTFKLVHYPTCYAPAETECLIAKLRTHGFDLIETQSTSFLPVSADPFEVNLAPAEQRRSIKCLRAGFQFRQWHSTDLTDVLHFLQETRRQKGYSLTISPERLADLFHSFPSHYVVFTIMDRDVIAALTITIRVRQDILYNFQPASHVAYQSFSPMVLLIKGLYTYCQQQKINLLDLGVSLDSNRQLKPSLLRFKQNLGARESPKLVFERSL